MLEEISNKNMTLGVTHDRLKIKIQGNLRLGVPHCFARKWQFSDLHTLIIVVRSGGGGGGEHIQQMGDGPLVLHFLSVPRTFVLHFLLASRPERIPIPEMSINTDNATWVQSLKWGQHVDLTPVGFSYVFFVLWTFIKTECIWHCIYYIKGQEHYFINILSPQENHVNTTFLLGLNCYSSSFLPSSLHNLW